MILLIGINRYMHAAYKYPLYSTVEQEIQLTQMCGSARWSWNHLLDLNQKQYDVNKRFVFRFSMLTKSDQFTNTPVTGKVDAGGDTSVQDSQTYDWYLEAPEKQKQEAACALEQRASHRRQTCHY